MPRAEVTPVLEHDASSGFGAVRGVHETNEPRTLSLEIRAAGNGYRLYIQTDDPVLQAKLGDHLEDELALDRDQLAGVVQSCRRTWDEVLVQHSEYGEKPFQRHWDFANRPDLLGKVMPKLALAGQALWRALFFPHDPGDRERYATLREIGKVLRREMAREGRWLRITADGFYVPWSLLYGGALGIDGEGWAKEGFWGYQHLIEHAPRGKGSLGHELAVADGEPVVVGLHLDRDIDTELNVPCIRPVTDLLDGYAAAGLATPRRELRRELAVALRDGALAEQVLFFCCHAQLQGVGEVPRFGESYLVLSDDGDPNEVRITPADIESWIDLRSFYDDGRRPLVFLNACGSGQLNSVFYRSFGETFLGLGACSVIGAQVDLPAVFAGEFARRFFERFFRGQKLGKILYDLRRELLDDHNNPLGLIYSLFRGADVQLGRRLGD